MDADAAEALQERLARQGWEQGCRLPFVRTLLLTDPDNPVSALAAEALAATRKPVAGPVAEVFVRAEQQVGSMLVTQVCDVVAHPAAEPNCEAMPIIKLAPVDKLPQPNSTRAFLLDAEQRLVVDATHRLQFEKSLIPDEDAEQLLTSPEQQRKFAAWLGRRSTRAAWPNDFEATVGAALRTVLAKSRFVNDDAYPHIHPLRVLLAGDGTETHLLLPYDETQVDAAAAQTFAADLLDQTRARLPTETATARKRALAGQEVRDFTIAALQPVPLDRLTLRVMLAAPPLNLEHLTYTSSGVVGVEPHAELET